MSNPTAAMFAMFSDRLQKTRDAGLTLRVVPYKAMSGWS